MFLPLSLVFLLLAASAHGRALDDLHAQHGERQVDDTFNFNIDEQALSNEAAGTREGRNWITRLHDRYLAAAREKMPETVIFWDEKHKTEKCYFARYSAHNSNLNDVGITIQVIDIHDMDSGDEYRTESVTAELESTLTVNTRENSNTAKNQFELETGGKFTLKTPLVKIETDLKYKHSKTTTDTKSATFTNKDGQKDKVEMTAKDTYKCPKDHHCRLQAWTFQVAVNGTAPLVPMVNPGCLLSEGQFASERNSPLKVYGGVLEQLRRRGVWWYTGSQGEFGYSPSDPYSYIYNSKARRLWKGPYTMPTSEAGTVVCTPQNYYGIYEGELEREDCPFDQSKVYNFAKCGTDGWRKDIACKIGSNNVAVASLYGNMGWLDDSNAPYYKVTLAGADGTAAALPNVPYPVDDNMPQEPLKAWRFPGLVQFQKDHPNYPQDDPLPHEDWVVPTGPQEESDSLPLPQWEWNDRYTGRYGDRYNVQYHQSKDWDIRFMARNSNDNSLMSAIVVIQEPYKKEDLERRQEEGVATEKTVKILYENINYNI